MLSHNWRPLSERNKLYQFLIHINYIYIYIHICTIYTNTPTYWYLIYINMKLLYHIRILQCQWKILDNFHQTFRIEIIRHCPAAQRQTKKRGKKKKRLITINKTRRNPNQNKLTTKTSWTNKRGKKKNGYKKIWDVHIKKEEEEERKVR